MVRLPVSLAVAGRRCAIVGAGRVAARRARALCEAGADVTVIGPEVAAEFDSLDVHIERRAFQPRDVAGAWLVVIATDDAGVNEQAAQAARAAGALVNRADDPDAGDLVVPAHRRVGPVTLAVDTGGASASAAATICDELAQAMDEHWPVLLTEAAAHRPRIQQTCYDPGERRRRLARLVDAEARAILKSTGVEALRRHYESLSADLQP